MESGFTLVELLIVIVVIAVLAAISVVAYNGVQNRAHATTVVSDLRNAHNKAELFRIDSDDGGYPTGIDTFQQAGIIFTKTSYNAVIICRNSSNSTSTMWAIVADGKDGKSYYVSSSQITPTEFTANKVRGTSGGITCPTLGMGSWLWISQAPNNWAY